MLEAVKQALGIRSDIFDGELTTLIAAAKADLALSGITVLVDTDELLITAVVCYCQANRGTDGESREVFSRLYASQKRSMMYAGEYHDT